mgnify:CR=1 FL=1
MKDISFELSSYAESLNSKPEMSLKDYSNNDTALIVVDVINGFTIVGALSSERVTQIIGKVGKLMRSAIERSIDIVFFADSHTKDSTEFKSFPPHCLINTTESEVVEELKAIGHYTLIEKNSTNGYHAPKFKQYLKDNPNVKNFIVCGDCTDICVLNLCLSLKTAFDQDDKECNVIVPMQCVETFDAPSHSAELMNVMAFKLLETNGILLYNFKS